MKALVFLQQLPLYIIRPPPGKPRRTFLQPKTTTNPYLSPRKWKLSAEAKGFARAPAPANMKVNKSKQKSSIARESSNTRRDGDSDEKIPEVVMERMIVRILVNVGVPFVAGIALLHLFDVLKEQNLWDVPKWLTFMTTFVTFGASTLGIAYGSLSTCWDPQKKGSLLGFEEAHQNWAELWREEDESDR